MMMEEQLEEGRKELEECERVKDKVDESLKAMEGFVKNEKTGTMSVNGVGKGTTLEEVETTQRMWKIIQELDHD